MRKPRTLLAIIVLLVTGALLGAFVFWPAPDVSQECLDRIHVGMPFDDAEPILLERGFVLMGGGVNSGEATMVFKRVSSKAIIVGVPRSGRISFIELGERENVFLGLWRKLTERPMH